MQTEAHREHNDSHRRLIRRLETQAADVERLTRGLDEGALSRRVDPEKWSLKELVAHLAIIQKLFRGRAERMLREDSPSLDAYDPVEDHTFEASASRPGAAIISEFFAERLRFTKMLEELTAADWHRSALHPEFDIYDIHFLADYLLYHEAHHLYQMLRRRSAFGRIPH